MVAKLVFEPLALSIIRAKWELRIFHFAFFIRLLNRSLGNQLLLHISNFPCNRIRQPKVSANLPYGGAHCWHAVLSYLADSGSGSVTMRSTFHVLITFSLILLLLTSGCVIPASIYIKQGDSCAKQGQLEEAIGKYSQAIEFNSNLSAAYKGRGLIYFDQGQWSSAITDLSKALELDPQFATELSPKLAIAYSNRGHDYTTQESYDLAIADLTKAIEIDPQLLTAQYLADIVVPSTSRIKTVYIDIDIVTTGLDKGSVNESCIFPTTASGMYDYANNEMKVEVDSSGSWLGRQPPFTGHKTPAEYYVVNGTEYLHIYFEHNNNHFWYQFKPDELVVWESHDQFSRQRDLLISASSVTLGGAEKIDGVECYTVLVRPNAEILYEFLNTLGPCHMLDFSGVNLNDILKKVDIKEWITKTQYLPVKMEMNITGISSKGVGISTKSIDSVNMKIQMKFRDFDKPVSVELPTEAYKETARDE